MSSNPNQCKSDHTNKKEGKGKLHSGHQTPLDNISSQASTPSQLSTGGKSGYDADDELSSRSQISSNTAGTHGPVELKSISTNAKSSPEHHFTKRKHHTNIQSSNLPDANKSSSDDSV
ncbi:unnamed protein product [Orchesella dallaii]|uniref:Uncharacterized protein n=1 Tax=Orchesella dallaii TaxID=48710 RepID=A0ABP1RXD5_9HEXA